jgi:hypothetical protein
LFASRRRAKGDESTVEEFTVEGLITAVTLSAQPKTLNSLLGTGSCRLVSELRELDY